MCPSAQSAATDRADTAQGSLTGDHKHPNLSVGTYRQLNKQCPATSGAKLVAPRSEFEMAVAVAPPGLRKANPMNRRLILFTVAGAWLAVSIPATRGSVLSAYTTTSESTGGLTGNHHLFGNFFPTGDPESRLGLDTSLMGVYWEDHLPTAEFPAGETEWDLVFTVRATLDTAETGVSIAYDKYAWNSMSYPVTAVRWTLGTGLHTNFLQSSGTDALYFGTDPAPLEPSCQLPNPPLQDRPLEPDALSWSADIAIWPQGAQYNFLAAIHIPPSLFVVDSLGEMAEAVFTLREHISVPEPAGLVLAGLGLLGMCVAGQPPPRGGRLRLPRLAV